MFAMARLLVVVRAQVMHCVRRTDLQGSRGRRRRRRASRSSRGSDGAMFARPRPSGSDERPARLLLLQEGREARMSHDEPLERRDDLLLPEHHLRLERLLDEVRALARGDDHRAFCLGWARFEHELGAHLRAEERHLLPAFSEHYPVEAKALLAEHDELRRLVEQLAVDAELHLLRAERANQLIERLRAHAKREDALLYTWASRHLRRGLSLRPTLEALEQLRDELRLKLHLAGMEARERFERLSREIEAVRGRTGTEARAQAESLLAALRSVGESFADGND
jgi:hemerythrin-like domain-containing protein